MSPGMNDAISFERVSKRYLIRKQNRYLVHAAVRKIIRRGNPVEEFWALRDVSFSIRPGESVAFVGGNGAGKSTLLGLVAGTLFPTRGHIRVKGRIGALLELGAGFHPDMTGRENIYLNASLLGISRDEVDQTYEQIVAFSELEDFIDAPLRTYSSGMYVRLGFSVAIHVKPDILIMDEVMAVGDQHFQLKCLEKIHGYREQRKTLLFVSHAPEAVASMCERVIWLDHGHVRMDGPVQEVMDAYQAFMVG
jgi:ABC-type polysaccharide/polyol phosphate transport system ATPase subunit